MKDNKSDSNSWGNKKKKKKKLIKNHIIYQLADNSLFCVCCWTAESSPALERTADAAVGLGCCWGTETLTGRGDWLLWIEVWFEGWGCETDSWGCETEAWAWGRGLETDDWICNWLWANKACDTCSWWGTSYWTRGSLCGWEAVVWGTEFSGPGRAIWGPVGGEKVLAAGLPVSWIWEGEQISGVFSGSEWSGETSAHWSDITVQVSWPETAWVWGWDSLSLVTGEASDSIGTTGSAPTNNSEVIGGLSACCGRKNQKKPDKLDRFILSSPLHLYCLYCFKATWHYRSIPEALHTFYFHLFNFTFGKIERESLQDGKETWCDVCLGDGGTEKTPGDWAAGRRVEDSKFSKVWIFTVLYSSSSASPVNVTNNKHAILRVLFVIWIL